MSKGVTRTVAKPFCNLLDGFECDFVISKFNHNRNETLAIGVVQLLRTFAPLHNEWMVTDTGVVAFVKDYGKKSFFFRLLCFHDFHIFAWEQEVYDEIRIPVKVKNIPMIIFEAHVCFVHFSTQFFTLFIDARIVLLVFSLLMSLIVITFSM